MRNKDRFRGCLCGAAVGDALGYPVRSLEDSDIFQHFGENGITEYVPDADGVAEVSANTQAALYTANALLAASTDRKVTGDKVKPYRQYLIDCYRDWFRAQEKNDGQASAGDCAWLCGVPEMNCRRAPSGISVGVLSGEQVGCVRHPINDSRECGGLLRAAPVGLFFGSGNGQMPKIDQLAAESAAITHGGELGYLPAAVLAHIVHRGAFCEMSLEEAIEDAMETVGDLFPDSVRWNDLQERVDRAIELADEEGLDDLDCIRELGQGDAAEEVLAIAIFCALKYQNDFGGAVIAAVNHNGDSAATGGVTGCILGAFMGVRAIPLKWIRNLEMLDIIAEMADDLCDGCRPDPATGEIGQAWLKKYRTDKTGNEA